jgi:hypothetical protein
MSSITFAAVVASLVLLAGVVYPLTSARAAKWVRTHNFSTQTVAQLAATFLGVVLALWATDWQRQSDDRYEALAALDRMIASTENRLAHFQRVRRLNWSELATPEGRRNAVAFLRPALVTVWAKSERLLRFVSVDFAVLLGRHETIAESFIVDVSSATDKEIAEKTLDEVVTTNQLLLGALWIERYHVLGSLSGPMHQFIYRCRLDPAKAPFTERGFDEGGCAAEFGELQRTDSRKSKAAAKRLEQKFEAYGKLFERR